MEAPCRNNTKYIDVERLEFTVTNACTGRCKHCSNGGNASDGESLEAGAAVVAVKRLAENFKIKSVMTFGGEPLLHVETVCKIHAAARECAIPNRQLITNGFFSRDSREIDRAAEALCASGVNDVLLSVDAFHQEYIPLEHVLEFADSLLRHAVPSLRVQPAWLVNEAHDNPYNNETKRILKIFTDKGIRANEGNNIFPAGNALVYLAQWFSPPEEPDLSVPCGSAPYTAPLDEIGGFCIGPDGEVNLCSISIGNIYRKDIMDIVNEYDPYDKPSTRALLRGGVAELLSYARSLGADVDIGDCHTACNVCHKVMAAISE
ncbi:MAG: radical SAM protein [Clostridiales bacterium]|jgi:MoaA/NifB/PqqE/SkfB family radical SAM enzyme|nr:radical SAM protein [Clostridiales bacterium]